MKLRMHAVVVEATEADEIVVSQETSSGEAAVRVTVEQVPFLIELLHQARAKVEETRHRRQSD